LLSKHDIIEENDDKRTRRPQVLFFLAAMLNIDPTVLQAAPAQRSATDPKEK
jgi:hypothetical protein